MKGFSLKQMITFITENKKQDSGYDFKLTQLHE